MRAPWIWPSGLCSVTAGGALHFLGEIGRGLVDAFADLEPQESLDLNFRAQFFGGVLQYFVHLRLAIDHEDLLEQDLLFVELAQASLDHLLDDVGGLA